MIRELTIALLTAGVVVAAMLVFGLVLLFRRRDGARSSSASGLEALDARANVALVRLDETLATADNELGFAIAQFGEGRTADFATAVDSAKRMSTSAFRLRRELDDAFPESETKRREMTMQIIAYAEGAQTSLERQTTAFGSLRSAEVTAPASLAALGARIAAATTRIGPARETLARLSTAYRPALTAEHESAITQAESQLAAAGETVTAATARLSPTGVNAVTPEVQAAQQTVASAIALLDSIDTLAEQFDKAAATVTTQAAATTANLAEARAQRESAPDAETGEAIVDAIDRLQKTLAATSSAKAPNDPLESLDQLNAATAELDTALAAARNQSQRLEHARAALAATLVSATSQIAAVRGFITAGGGRVGADARSRLSEADRELAEAQRETDPVAALDAARRAVTSARDADALARYDAMR